MHLSTRALAALIALPLLGAACGIANPFAPASAANQNDQLRLKWAQCMRQHGVNVPDPDPNGGPVTIRSTAGPNVKGGTVGTGGGGPNPDDQQFQAALTACKQYQPNGGQGSAQDDQRAFDQALKFSQCMREHGIAFPDPQQVSGGHGVRIEASPGAFDPGSDQFKQAQQACQKYMPGPAPKSGS